MVRIERVTLSMEWIVVSLVLLGNKLDCSGRKVTTTSNPRIRTHGKIPEVCTGIKVFGFKFDIKISCDGQMILVYYFAQHGYGILSD